jgi:hypothetical protein
VLFLLTLVISIAIGATGPDVQERSCLSNGTECKPVDLRNTDTFTANITNLDGLNQELMLECVIANPRKVKASYDVEFTLSGLGVDAAEKSVSSMPVDHPLERKPHNRTITCSAGSDMCQPVTLIHYPFVEYSQYLINVSVAEESRPAITGEMHFTYIFTNHKFTLFELWFRFAFLIGTFIWIVIFSHKLRRYRWADWQVEQKWTAFLLFALLGYNNPFFPAEILTDSWFPIFLDQLLAVTFLAGLMLFWLIMFDGVRKEAAKRSCFKFYLPKFLLIGALWASTLAVFTQAEMHLLSDPRYSEVEDDPDYVFFLVVQLVLTVVWLFWLVYVVIRACTESSQFPLLGLRLKFFGLFTLAIIVTTGLSILFNVLSPIHNNAAEFLVYRSLFNLYVYVLAYMYLPATSAAGYKRAGREGRPVGMVRLADDDDTEEEIDH